MKTQRRPFPTFVIWLLVFLGALLFLLTQCSGLFSGKEPPSLTIKAEGVQLSWVMEKNHWNGIAYDRINTFASYGEKISFPSQAAAGERVSITLDTELPERATLLEYALRSNEDSIYGEAQLLSEYPFYFNNRTSSFFLPEPEEHPVRGYLLRCEWGEDVCEYAIVVQILEE